MAGGAKEPDAAANSEGSSDPRAQVTDEFLLSVLKASDDAKEQCMALLDFLDQTPRQPSAAQAQEAAVELSKQKKLLYAQLARVRNMNRQAIMDVRQTKAKTAEARQEVDTLHLQLQNLYYEQRHLKNEIAACEDFDHKYQRLNMISETDFLSEFPEHMNDDEDDLMYARIAHEHAERQTLEDRRQALLKKKQALIAENKKRKEDLANLDKDLEKFIDAAKPIIETFKKEY